MNICSFTVPAIREPRVAREIADALRSVQGVSETAMNVPARIVQVAYDQSSTDPHALKSVIEEAGYLVQRYSDGYR